MTMEAAYASEPAYPMQEKKIERLSNFKQWSSGDGRVYFPVSDTCNVLPPDVYEFTMTQAGAAFERIMFEQEDLLRFSDSKIDEVVEEIQTFWKRESLFNEFGLQFKRGILLYGPPGSGKSCAAKLIIQDVIKQGGIAVRFTHVSHYTSCMKIFRELQPKTPVVVIMEDVETLLQGPSSDILNVLDGIGGFEKVAYLATTNYPEVLEPRVKNRPSRFDKRFLIDHPSPSARSQYIEHLSSKSNKITIDSNRWVEDTKGMSFAHIKELFISVNLFGREYDDTLKTLRDMSKKLSSESFEESQVGFARTSPHHMRRAR